MGIFERSVYKYAVAFGPFETYVFSHCKRCWGSLWEQRSLLIHCSCCRSPV